MLIQVALNQACCTHVGCLCSRARLFLRHATTCAFIFEQDQHTYLAHGPVPGWCRSFERCKASVASLATEICRRNIEASGHSTAQPISAHHQPRFQLCSIPQNNCSLRFLDTSHWSIEEHSLCVYSIQQQLQIHHMHGDCSTQLALIQYEECSALAFVVYAHVVTAAQGHLSNSTPACTVSSWIVTTKQEEKKEVPVAVYFAVYLLALGSQSTRQKKTH